MAVIVPLGQHLLRPTATTSSLLRPSPRCASSIGASAVVAIGCDHGHRSVLRHAAQVEGRPSGCCCALLPLPGCRCCKPCPTTTRSATPTPSVMATTRSPRCRASPSRAATRGRARRSDRAAQSEGRVTAAVRAEWTKLRTLPSTGWLLVAAGGVTVAGAPSSPLSCTSIPAARPDPDQAEPRRRPDRPGIDRRSCRPRYFRGIRHRHDPSHPRRHASPPQPPRRQGRQPGRAHRAGRAAAAAGGCLIVGRLILPGAGSTPPTGTLISLDHAPTLRAAAGSVLYLVFIGLLRWASPRPSATPPHQSAPCSACSTSPQSRHNSLRPNLRRHLEQIAPMTAGLAIQASTNLHSRPIAPWAGLGVLAAWAAARAPRRRTPAADPRRMTPTSPSRDHPNQRARQLIKLVAGRWTLPVLAELACGGRRYQEPPRRARRHRRQGVDRTLRRPERDGWITRHLDADRVKSATLYELTDLGRSLETKSGSGPATAKQLEVVIAESLARVSESLLQPRLA